MKLRRLSRYALVLAGISILLPTSGCALDAGLVSTLVNTVLPLVVEAVLAAAGTAA